MSTEPLYSTNKQNFLWGPWFFFAKKGILITPFRLWESCRVSLDHWIHPGLLQRGVPYEAPNPLHKCQSSSWETLNLRVIELHISKTKKTTFIHPRPTSLSPSPPAKKLPAKQLHFFMYLLIHNKVAGKRLDLPALRMGRALPGPRKFVPSEAGPES